MLMQHVKRKNRIILTQFYCKLTTGNFSPTDIEYHQSKKKKKTNKKKPATNKQNL